MKEKAMKEKLGMKERIVQSAWELFYEKGYEQTTIIDIIEKSGVAKGSFYYHFKGKDTLLNTLSLLLDQYYMELDQEMPKDMDSFEKLMFLNYKSHTYIEKKIDYDLIGRLYASQIIKTGESNLLDRERYYFQLITRIVEEGKERNQITKEKSTEEIVNYYSMCERALVTDWCMNNGNFSLGEVSKDYLRRMMISFKADSTV